jgi:hypothetical protein
MISLLGNFCLLLHIRGDRLSTSPDQLMPVWLWHYQGERYFTVQVLSLGLMIVASFLWRLVWSCRIGNREPGPGVGVQIRILCAERI